MCMKLKELLIKIDIKELSQKFAEQFYCDDYFPKPSISQDDLAKKLKKVIKNICLIHEVDTDILEIIVVAKVWDTVDTDKMIFESFVMKQGNKERYCINMTSWKELVGFEVLQKSIELYGEIDVALQILHDITFFGFEEKQRDVEIEKIIETLNVPIDEKDCMPAEEVFKQFYSEYGIPEKTEEEKENQSNRTRLAIKKNDKIYKQLLETI